MTAMTNLTELSNYYLNILCSEIPERCVGSEGNRMATRFFEQTLIHFGWNTESRVFDAIDWHDGGATLSAGDISFNVHVSPYSTGCEVTSELIMATSVVELEALDCRGKILLLAGEIVKEQLMPKNFVFYNPEEHQRIVACLERSGALAIVCATGRNASLAGGMYPFPLIEDGDFDIPSVYMTDKEGERLAAFTGKTVSLHSASVRIPGNGYNIIGRKGKAGSGRIVITAHIDAKKGTPGAIDNGTGVTILLLIAQLLHDYDGSREIEIVALNGEDYYAVPGQMDYLAANQGVWGSILLNINIDGAGYKTGNSAFSFYDLPDNLLDKATEVMQMFPGIEEGVQWPQGDHSIFIQQGRPAIAVSSKWFTDNVADQDITHTPNDHPGIVDHQKVVELAEAINMLVRML